jgi:hypothetical protein
LPNNKDNELTDGIWNFTHFVFWKWNNENYDSKIIDFFAKSFYKYIRNNDKSDLKALGVIR